MQYIDAIKIFHIFLIAVFLHGCSFTPNQEINSFEGTISPALSEATTDIAPSHENMIQQEVPSFNGENAYQHILNQIDFGYRIPGSIASHETAMYIRQYLESSQWQVRFQEFDHQGVLVRNVIASKNEFWPEVIIGTHYDTRAKSDRDENPASLNTPVTGANDGASGTAVLLELGRILQESNRNIWLVFFDAEDQGNIDGWDWSVGARYFVNHLDSPLNSVIIIDMVGDANLEIYKETNSDQYLCGQIWSTASFLDLDDYFIDQEKYTLIDDHVPFLEKQVPACLVIDFDYPYWHTTQDTADKVSPESLKVVGDTLLQWLQDQY